MMLLSFLPLYRFFTPTIRGMQGKSNLYILVLSNGGYDGLGLIREKEMQQAAKSQGFVGCKVLDHPDLKDGPIYKWKEDVISKQIELYL